MTDEIVKTALELILDVRSHPVLVIDPCVFYARNALEEGCGPKWKKPRAKEELQRASGG